MDRKPIPIMLWNTGIINSSNKVIPQWNVAPFQVALSQSVIKDVSVTKVNKLLTKIAVNHELYYLDDYS